MRGAHPRTKARALCWHGAGKAVAAVVVVGAFFAAPAAKAWAVASHPAAFPDEDHKLVDMKC